MGLLVSICFVALVLLIWFDTDAFTEYAKLFNWKFGYLDEYLEMVKNAPGFSYLDYLLEYRNNFFTRLISCPICTSVWIGFFVSIFASVLYSPMIILGGLVLYKLARKAILD